MQDNIDSFKKALLIRVLDSASKLEGQAASQIMPEVFSDVEDAMESGKNLGVRVVWFDKMIGEFLKAKDHQKLTDDANFYKRAHEDLQRQPDGRRAKVGGG